MNGDSQDDARDSAQPASPSSPAEAPPSAAQAERVLLCKPYHESHGRTDEGLLRLSGDKKSRCPGWTLDLILRQRLLDDALIDPSGAIDFLGRPKRVWNAIANWTFVGVATNEQELAYNCYPETPATALIEELAQRAQRTIEDFLGNGDDD